MHFTYTAELSALGIAFQHVHQYLEGHVLHLFRATLRMHNTSYQEKIVGGHYPSRLPTFPAAWRVKDGNSPSSGIPLMVLFLTINELIP